MKIRPVEAGLFFVDGRTDGRRDTHDEANISFSQFCGIAPKNRTWVYVILHFYTKFGGKNYDPEILLTMSGIIICLV